MPDIDKLIQAVVEAAHREGFNLAMSDTEMDPHTLATANAIEALRNAIAYGVKAAPAPQVSRDQLNRWHDYMVFLMEKAGIERSDVLAEMFRASQGFPPPAVGVAGNDYHTNCHEPLMKDDPT